MDTLALLADGFATSLSPLNLFIVILGVMVTVLAFGVFLPMWNLSGVMG